MWKIFDLGGFPAVLIRLNNEANQPKEIVMKSILFFSSMFVGVSVFASATGFGIEVNARAIPGTYQIVSRNSNKCLDVFNHLFTDKAGLAQWDCTGEPHQRFKLVDKTRGSFSLLAKRNGYCLTALSTQNGSQVVQRAACSSQYDPALSDYVRFHDMGDGSYSVALSRSNRCMDVTSGSKTNGAKVQIWDCHSGSNQRWELQRVAPTDQSQVYSMQLEGSDKCLDVTDRSYSSGTQLQIWACTREANQAFTFDEGESDLVSTTSAHSSLAVGIAGDSTISGAAVRQIQYNGTLSASAYGRFVPVGDKSFQFRFSHTGKCLTAGGGSNGSRVTQQDCDGRDGQRWILNTLR